VTKNKVKNVSFVPNIPKKDKLMPPLFSIRAIRNEKGNHQTTQNGKGRSGITTS
jgi:hypothetical protein